MNNHFVPPQVVQPQQNFRQVPGGYHGHVPPEAVAAYFGAMQANVWSSSLFDYLVFINPNVSFLASLTQFSNLDINAGQDKYVPPHLRGGGNSGPRDSHPPNHFHNQFEGGHQRCKFSFEVLYPMTNHVLRPSKTVWFTRTSKRRFWRT